MKLMMTIMMLMVGLLMPGCGYDQRDSEAIGQVKKTMHLTPIWCPNYDMVDVSLGVMRNGVGSMSTEDVWFSITKDSHYQLLKKAAETGALIRVKYDVARIVLCQNTDYIITDVELVK